MDNVEKRIIELIDEHAQELQALAEDIYTHAEQGYHEFRTAAIAADLLRGLGLEPETGLAITGVKAVLGKNEGPNVALIGELDGLACPDHQFANNGFAHSCGHYAQMVCLLGAAIALCDHEVASALDGKVTFFAVPAEEFQDSSVRKEVREKHDVHCGGGKCELIRRGQFDDIDILGRLDHHVHTAVGRMPLHFHIQPHQVEDHVQRVLQVDFQPAHHLIVARGEEV